MENIDRRDISVFVSYASCMEEREYCRSAARTVPALADGASEISQSAMSAYESVYKIRFLDEVLDPSLLHRTDIDGIRQARATHLTLYILILEKIKQRYRIAGAAGFSAGYSSLMVCARSLSAAEWLSNMYPAIRPYSVENLEVYASGNLHTRLFCSYASTEFSAFVRDVAATSGFDVVLKDDRAPYAVQLTGRREELVEISDIVEKTYPGSGATSTAILRTDAGHIKPERYPGIKDAFLQLRTRPPSFEVATHVDGIMTDCDSAVRLNTALFNALHAPLAMGNVNRYLTGIHRPMIYVGSRRTARFAFFGFGPRVFDGPSYHWEDVLLSGNMDSPMLLPQETPSWKTNDLL